MKKTISILTTALMALFVLCTGALAQGSPRIDVWQGQLAVCANVELTACDIYVSRDLYPTQDACLRQMNRYAADIRRQTSGVQVRFRCVALPAA